MTVAKSDLPKPASDLKAGKQLPFFYGDPPPELLNTPLEELDPYYQSKKTFIVLGKGNIIHRFNAESACYLLSPFNLLRTAAIKIHIHLLFRLFILVTVLTNCVFMTMSNPPEWRETAEHVFTAIYTLEVLIKMMSRGLCFGSFTFLRDPWNWLDILVVLTGYLTWIVSIKTLSVLRTVTRVLKIITVIPGLKKTVGDVVQSLRKLADVITLMVFWLCLLALIALQLFMGSLKHKCIISSWLAPAGSTEFDFTEHVLNTENQYHLPGQVDPLLCGNSSDSGACPEGYTCLRAGKNPNYGYTSYDSFGWSLLNMVRLMTQDFWENLMQLMLRSSGSHLLVFFMGIVFPGFLQCDTVTLQQNVDQFYKESQQTVAKSDLPKPASDLKAGKQLPFFYGDPPPELLNTPLEELDPYYQSKKTFIVLGKGNIIHRFNAESACYLLSPFNLLRTAAIKIHIHLYPL
uniref:sodium channel protein type 4 subunit alpha B-like n=1 Tax=Epinephelus lanceolatus TaxID=310571 RepID=UPI001446B3D1|nr:sodium channel protein type 4 subunit alpha B-like [Epinephelus lanceolatus]